MSEATGGTGVRYKFGKAKTGLKFPKGARLANEAGRHLQTFDTLQDLLAAARFSSTGNRTLWANSETENHQAAKTRPLEWYGIEGGAAAVRAAITEGWPAGVDQMRNALDDIGATLKPRSVRRVRRWTDQGDSVDMPRVWAGRSDVAWQRCHRESRQGAQLVTIAANVTALRDVNGRDLFWRGAAVLKLSDLLTEAGYNVRIDAMRYSTGAFTSGESILQRVTVKEPTAPLELNSLAAVLCLSGFFRLALFQAQCLPDLKSSSLMGHSAVYTSTTGEIVGVERCMSRDAARDWINEQLTMLDGGEIKAA